MENTDSDDLEEKKVSKTKGKPKSKSKPKTKEKKKSKSKDLSKKSKFEKKDKNHSKEQTNKKNTPNTKTDANAIFPKKSMEIEKIRAPQPSLFTISRDVEEISTNVNSFIDSLNTSWRFSNRTFERTVRIPRKSAFLDETQNYSRSKSPIFQEKQTDTNELEVYRKMFEKKKIPIYYEKEIDTNGLNTQNERKKAKMNDSFQQTDLIDSSPMFNRNFNNNQPNIGHSIKDLYKPKSKYGFLNKL